MEGGKKLSVLALGLVFLALQACTPQYIIQPTNTTVAKDATFTVDIGLDHCVDMNVGSRHHFFCGDTSDVYGVAFDLDYDPAVIQFQSISVAGSVLSGTAAVTGFRNSGVENGKLVVGISKSGQVAGESGQGKVATITFKATAIGSTPITFKDPHLVNSAGKFLVGWPWYAATLQKANVTVQ